MVLACEVLSRSVAFPIHNFGTQLLSVAALTAKGVVVKRPLIQIANPENRTGRPYPEPESVVRWILVAP